jgi:hypothetical protein
LLQESSGVSICTYVLVKQVNCVPAVLLPFRFVSVKTVLDHPLQVHRKRLSRQLLDDTDTDTDTDIDTDTDTDTDTVIDTDTDTDTDT